jgi:hypothetical protein
MQFCLFLTEVKAVPTNAMTTCRVSGDRITLSLNLLNTELSTICHLLELLGAHPILYISRIRVNLGPKWEMGVYFYALVALLAGKEPSVPFE